MPSSSCRTKPTTITASHGTLGRDSRRRIADDNRVTKYGTSCTEKQMANLTARPQTINDAFNLKLIEFGADNPIIVQETERLRNTEMRHQKVNEAFKNFPRRPLTGI